MASSAAAVAASAAICSNVVKQHSPRLWKSFIVETGFNGSRLDTFMRHVAPGTPHSLMCSLARRGRIRVAGKRARKTSVRIAEGDEVLLPKSLYPPSCTQSPKLLPVSDIDKHDHPLRKLWEDDEFVVVDKPIGLPVQGGSDCGAPSVVSMAWRLRADNLVDEPRIVHRLDKSVSGVLLLAKTRQSARAFSELLQEPLNPSQNQLVQKTYVAIVSGKLHVINDGNTQTSSSSSSSWNICKSDVLSATNALGVERMYTRDWLNNSSQNLTPSSRVRSSISSWRRLASNNAGVVSLLALRTLTGRKHQLRVMCHQMLHTPVIGDTKYRPLHTRPAHTAPRLLLHAASMQFKHPFTNRNIIIDSPLPEQFKLSANEFGVPIPRSIFMNSASFL